MRDWKVDVWKTLADTWCVCCVQRDTHTAGMNVDDGKRMRIIPFPMLLFRYLSLECFFSISFAQRIFITRTEVKQFFRDNPFIFSKLLQVLWIIFDRPPTWTTAHDDTGMVIKNCYRLTGGFRFFCKLQSYCDEQVKPNYTTSKWSKKKTSRIWTLANVPRKNIE